VDQAGDEPLEELPLAEDDHRLVLHALGGVAEAVGRLAELYEVDEQLGAAGKKEAADGEQRGERERSSRDVYESCAFLSSVRVRATAFITTAPFGAPR
jgi:hypothetical protein